MSDNIFAAFTDQSKLFLEPLAKMNALAISNLEKAINFQMSALQSYSSLGLKQLKNAGQISDAESLQDYGTSQIEFLGTLSKKIIEDAKNLTDLGLDIKNDFEALLQETQEAASRAPKAKPKAATAAKA